MSKALQPLLLLVALAPAFGDNFICRDTSGSGLDTDFDGCGIYSKNPDYCGNPAFNDEDFNSNEMCCGCGGGEQIEVIPPSYISDPGFKYQDWYLGPLGSNVVAAWDAGYTGKSVQIYVMDDGLDYTHADFSSKFRQSGSFRDPMPSNCKTIVDPSTQEEYGANSHGTTCGGIAAADDNDSCGVGVAFDATVSATNFFRDGCSGTGCSGVGAWHALQRGACGNENHVSTNSWGIDACDLKGGEADRRNLGEAACPFEKGSPKSPCVAKPPQEVAYCENQDWSSPPTGDCLSFISQYCSISSWHTHLGHTDPACTDYMDLFVTCDYRSLSNLMTTALLNGVTYGREGKGIVYVFAAGNEFMQEDDVNYEGWLNSMYTITVGAIAGDDKHSSYSSAGAPVLVSAQGGDWDQRMNFIKTTPVLEGSCSAADADEYGGVGTSYATPIVSGVAALIMEANPHLGWRDVQDVLVRSAVPIDLHQHYADWETNAAFLKHSPWYGFGKVDALAAVNLAKDYPAAETNVEQTFVAKRRDFSSDLFLPKGLKTVTSITVDDEDAAKLLSVQHVSVYATASHNFRGRLQISIKSPSGITSMLSPGSSENEGTGMDSFKNWKFTTVRNWGEKDLQLEGEWVLTIENEFGVEEGDGELQEWTLVLYGSGSGLVKKTVPEECFADDDPNWGNVNGGGECYYGKKEIDEMTWTGTKAIDKVKEKPVFPKCTLSCADSVMAESGVTAGTNVDFLKEETPGFAYSTDSVYCPTYKKLYDCYYSECPPSVTQEEGDDDWAFGDRCGHLDDYFLSEDDDAAVKDPTLYAHQFLRGRHRVGFGWSVGYLVVVVLG
ncbi:hypothetical protein TL16_g09060 [Triparma laevis f. inornata]|uniref:subtilisin n=2 Tax=Triparma laevis TaxID=1534972 RepID=A0A9W7FHF7_9STRA|nr:hypothetical protein TL16_g09060 [Triparma laevis f. inornata]GMI12098.1 hypothetical protein TrLO_g2638 [Triparma laevis f. longispina]